MNERTCSVKISIRRILPVVAAAAVIITAVILRSPPVRYSAAEAMLRQEEYAEALQAFEALGDYRDAALKAEEAESALRYLDAKTLMEQDQWDDARAILDTLGSYRDTETLLKQMQQYDQAMVYMSLALYEDAAEEFRALGDFRNAGQQAEECDRLAAVKMTYEDGVWEYRNGKWLDAYRTLSSVREEAYGETLSILDEIAAAAEELIPLYAEQGERGKLLAFLRLMDEIDAARGAALRQELAPAETIEEDWSYFQFDPVCLTSCSPDTDGDAYAATMLYMILNGETEHTLVSDSPLDKAETLGNFYLGQNILGDVIPGYGLVYKMKAAVQENSVRITMEYREEYSEEEFGQIVETFETFCEDSLRELAATGLISASMTRRQKAELISEWIGFYLTYDKMTEIYLAGVAVENAKGVCSAYASLYHRICNLAGVPTYGQGGMAYDPVSYGPHIWLIHVDEAGDIFYADPTWADPWDLDFSKDEEKPTVEQFAQRYLERCMEDAVRKYKNPSAADTKDQRYFWSKNLWFNTHEAGRQAEEVIASHRYLQGETS